MSINLKGGDLTVNGIHIELGEHMRARLTRDKSSIQVDFKTDAFGALKQHEMDRAKLAVYDQLVSAGYDPECLNYQNATKKDGNWVSAHRIYINPPSAGMSTNNSAADLEAQLSTLSERYYGMGGEQAPPVQTTGGQVGWYKAQIAKLEGKSASDAIDNPGETDEETTDESTDEELAEQF